MSTLRIVALVLFAGIGYGIAHDQVTARICVEYFTIGHPPLFPTTSPTWLALGWGIVATWWVALPLGVLLALAARAGRAPAWDAAQLRRPIGLLLAAMGAAAALAAAVGATLASLGAVWLVPPLSARVPAERHVAFLTALWAHSASYAVGAIGGLALAWWVWRARRRVARAAAPASRAAA